MKEYYIRVFNQEELNEAIRLVEKLGYKKTQASCEEYAFTLGEKDNTHVATFPLTGTYGVYNHTCEEPFEQITINDLKEMAGDEPNNELNWLKDRMDKYYFQLRGAVSAEEIEEARIIAARLDEIEYVYNKLKG